MDESTKQRPSGRKVLGRGFSSLLPDKGAKVAVPAVPSTPSTGAPLKVNIALVHANENQPRKLFRGQPLEELRQSIEEKGILQPLIVHKRDDGGYDLVAGERRLRAATLAGLREVPVVVRPKESAQESLELALIENIQREDLNAIDEALAYQTLVEDYSLTQEILAKRVGKSRSTVANSMRLLKLPPKVKEYVASGELTAGQVRPLLSLTNPTKVQAVAEKIRREGLSARDVETLLQSVTSPTTKKSSAAKERTNPHHRHLTDRLRRRFSAKCEIKESGGKGRVEIHFYSLEELGRLLELMGVE